MFSNMRIGRRLMILISVLTLIFVSMGAVTLVGMSDMSNDTSELNAKTAEAAAFVKLAGSVRFHLVDVSQQLATGILTWHEAIQLLDAGAREFDTLWDRQRSRYAVSPDEVEFFTDAFGIEVSLVKEGYVDLIKIVEAENRELLSLFLVNDARAYSEPFLNAADALSTLGSVEAQSIYDSNQYFANLYLLVSAVVVISGLLIAITLGPMIFVSITSPIKRISQVVGRVADGDLEARTGLGSRDEIGQLGQAFDKMLNERVSTMSQVEEENDKLNNSVIDLLEAVSDLSNRDLTVNVPVAEDVTGPVADAMNMMAAETARVLAEIRKISHQVASAASTVETQGGKINQLADDERQIIEDTMAKLEEASKSMNIIARQAKGYLYYVSFKGITGASHLDEAGLAQPIQAIRAESGLPVAVGFGIKTPDNAAAVAAVADGVVIGSALIEHLENAASREEACALAIGFLAPVRLAMDNRV